VVKVVKNVSVRGLRAHLARILDDVKAHLDRYIISRHGEPEAVLMCIEDYEGWLETLAIMSSKKTMDSIKKAEKELAQGKFYRFEEVFGKNRKKKQENANLRNNNRAPGKKAD